MDRAVSGEAIARQAGLAGSRQLRELTLAEGRADTALEEPTVNDFAAVRCIRAVLSSMRVRQRGVIANVTSASGAFPWPNQACYAASKFALEGFSASLAHEVWRFGVRIVNVVPGAVRTEIVENSRSERSSTGTRDGAVTGWAFAVDGGTSR